MDDCCCSELQCNDKKRKKKINGKRCVAYGCSNTSKDGFNLFLFPSNAKINNLWIKEVQKMRTDFKQPSNYSCSCSAHFSRDMFDASCLLANEIGISKTMRLRADAIPTIVKPGGHVKFF